MEVHRPVIRHLDRGEGPVCCTSTAPIVDHIPDGYLGGTTWVTYQAGVHL